MAPRAARESVASVAAPAALGVPAARPAFCPYNDAQAKAINRTAAKFGCVADAGNRTAQYDWAQYWRSDGFGYAYPWQPVPAEKLPVFACMAQQMCASGCNATVGRLHELAQPYPLCAGMSTAPLSGAAYAARVASYYATSNGAEQDSAAFTYYARPRLLWTWPRAGADTGGTNVSFAAEGLRMGGAVRAPARCF